MGVFKGARPALAKSGLSLSRGLGGSPLGVPGCAHRSSTPSFEHRACLAGQAGGSAVGGIQDGSSSFLGPIRMHADQTPASAAGGICLRGSGRPSEIAPPPQVLLEQG